VALLVHPSPALRLSAAEALQHPWLKSATGQPTDGEMGAFMQHWGSELREGSVASIVRQSEYDIAVRCRRGQLMEALKQIWQQKEQEQQQQSLAAGATSAACPGLPPPRQQGDAGACPAVHATM
jgi:hypothetical protein